MCVINAFPTQNKLAYCNAFIISRVYINSGSHCCSALLEILEYQYILFKVVTDSTGYQMS